MKLLIILLLLSAFQVSIFPIVEASGLSARSEESVVGEESLQEDATASAYEIKAEEEHKINEVSEEYEYEYYTEEEIEESIFHEIFEEEADSQVEETETNKQSESEEVSDQMNEEQLAVEKAEEEEEEEEESVTFEELIEEQQEEEAQLETQQLGSEEEDLNIESQIEDVQEEEDQSEGEQETEAMISEDYDKYADDTTNEWGYPKSEKTKFKELDSDEEQSEENEQSDDSDDQSNEDEEDYNDQNVSGNETENQTADLEEQTNEDHKGKSKKEKSKEKVHVHKETKHHNVEEILTKEEDSDKVSQLHSHPHSPPSKSESSQESDQTESDLSENLLDDLINQQNRREEKNLTDDEKKRRRRKSKSKNQDGEDLSDEDIDVPMKFEKIEEQDAYDKPFNDYGPLSEEQYDGVEKFLREREFSNDEGENLEEQDAWEEFEGNQEKQTRKVRKVIRRVIKKVIHKKQTANDVYQNSEQDQQSGQDGSNYESQPQAQQRGQGSGNNNQGHDLNDQDIAEGAEEEEHYEELEHFEDGEELCEKADYNTLKEEEAKSDYESPRAIRYNPVDRQKEIENDLLRQAVDEQQNELKQTKKEHKSLKTQIKELKITIADQVQALKVIPKLNQTIDELRGQIDVQKMQIEATRAENEQSKNDFKELEENLKTVKQQLEKSKAELKESNQKLEDLKKVVDAQKIVIQQQALEMSESKPQIQIKLVRDKSSQNRDQQTPQTNSQTQPQVDPPLTTSPSVASEPQGPQPEDNLPIIRPFTPPQNNVTAEEECPEDKPIIIPPSYKETEIFRSTALPRYSDIFKKDQASTSTIAPPTTNVPPTKNVPSSSMHDDDDEINCLAVEDLQNNDTKCPVQTKEEMKKTFDDLMNEEQSPQITSKPLAAQPIAKPNVSPSLCIVVYSECNFEGKQIKLCGRFPDIPDTDGFLIKSVKIPPGVMINFYIDFEIDGKKIMTLQGEQMCLAKPFEITQLTKKKQSQQQLKLII